MEYEYMGVSVHCLVYNHEKYLRKCLDGFVMQKTNFKFEILIHDDASTDHSADIIREYEMMYPDIIKPIYQTENQYSKNINILKTFQLPRAKGKYVAFCEGDDYWCDENKLQKQFDLMEANPECPICVHKVQCVNEDGSINEKTLPDSKLKLSKKEVEILNENQIAKMLWIKGCYPFQTSSYFIRLSIFNDYLKDLPFAKFLNGDEIFIRLSLNNGEFLYINKAMSCRRLFSIGSWSDRQNRLSEEEKKVKYMNYLKGQIAYDKYTNGKYNNYIRFFIANKLANKNIYKDDDIINNLGELYLTQKDLLKYLSLKNKLRYKYPKLYNILKKFKRKKDVK